MSLEIEVKPAKYIVAVSGGVDSVVLLFLLLGKYSKDQAYDFVIAHYDHGIRKDSAEDRVLVEKLALDNNLKFYWEDGNLGVNTSEATARESRYGFLERVKSKENADCIMTAHHQDDVIETMIINLIRGTNRKGINSLRNTSTICRPLLNFPKSKIEELAKKEKLVWREDSTNQDTKYLRNYIRQNVVTSMTDDDRQKALAVIAEFSRMNSEIDSLLKYIFGNKLHSDSIDRVWFCSLPFAVAKEFIAEWLRQHNLTDFDGLTVARVAIAVKVARPNTTTNLLNGINLKHGTNDSRWNVSISYMQAR